MNKKCKLRLQQPAFRARCVRCLVGDAQGWPVPGGAGSWAGVSQAREPRPGAGLSGASPSPQMPDKILNILDVYFSNRLRFVLHIRPTGVHSCTSDTRGGTMTTKQTQNQIDFLQKAQETLGFNAKMMAAALCVDYDTYGKWRRGRRELKAAPKTSVLMLLVMKLCSIQKKDAFAEWMSQI